MPTPRPPAPSAPQSAPPTPRHGRRGLLAGASLSAGSLFTLASPPDAARATPSLGADPFTLGVASGDPEPHGVVLWTRLAPDPLNGGGMPRERVRVDWIVAEDQGLRRGVRRGTAVASPELAHSVHVEVNGLDPNREYFYRFSVRDEESPVGRTRTAPRRNDGVERLAFAKLDIRDARSPVVGAEFVCTSISSNGDTPVYRPYYGPMIPLNPHIKFFDGDRRGYVRCRLDRQRWQTDLRMESTVSRSDAPVSTLASFVVENGRPGAQRA